MAVFTFTMVIWCNVFYLSQYIVQNKYGTIKIFGIEILVMRYYVKYPFWTYTCDCSKTCHENVKATETLWVIELIHTLSLHFETAFDMVNQCLMLMNSCNHVQVPYYAAFFSDQEQSVTYLVETGLPWETGLDSIDGAPPVDTLELPFEVLLSRWTTLFLWFAGLTVTMRLWLLATIMSVTLNKKDIEKT